jgi:hypothetical protein
VALAFRSVQFVELGIAYALLELNHVASHRRNLPMDYVPVLFSHENVADASAQSGNV